jgi:DNA segregation ATPase FtsK/SpoIIIE-like protein
VLPRTLLIIDEFQEFFSEDDKLAQDAGLLLDRLVRQGRAFGIHVLLGSQTLGGAYTLARATIGQMVIRIALQCNEADAYLIMDESNAAPRLLSRPGEGIYNDAAGALEGNSPFQTVWLPDDVRHQCLERVQARARRGTRTYPGPIVFEGNAPADVRENTLLQALLDDPPRHPARAPRAWLGAPNSIKGPTEAVFQRQTGHNLLVVGQRDEAALALLVVTLVSLAAQHPPGSARFVLLDSSAPGTRPHEVFERLRGALPQKVERPKAGELAGLMNQLAADLHGRGGETPDAERPATFLLIHGLQNFKRLRQEDEFSLNPGDAESASPGAQLITLLSDGPSLGLHVIATCDAYSNVARFLGRKALGECALRVLFQMSASDSASLMDDPAAGALGMHRALFYHEQEGHVETFRPYALPGNDWLEEVAQRLARPRP